MKIWNYLIYLSLIVGINIILLLLSIYLTFEWCALFIVWLILYVSNRDRFDLGELGANLMLVDDQLDKDQHNRGKFKVNFLMTLPIMMNIIIGIWI